MHFRLLDSAFELNFYGTSTFKANDQSGFIGAAIVGGFIVVLIGWYGGRWAIQKLRKRAETESED